MKKLIKKAGITIGKVKSGLRRRYPKSYQNIDVENTYRSIQKDIKVRQRYKSMMPKIEKRKTAKRIQKRILNLEDKYDIDVGAHLGRHLAQVRKYERSLRFNWAVEGYRKNAAKGRKQLLRERIDKLRKISKRNKKRLK